jgi:hypothetical protein
MADYSSTPIQIIAQGVLTIDAAGNPQISGSGFSIAARGAMATGDFVLTFDEGTSVADVGSGGIVDEPGFGYSTGIVGPNGIDPRFARVALTMRGGTTAPGTTTITDRSAAFVSVPGQGATQIQIGLFIDPATPADPMGAGAPNANGGGLEIVIWYGNAGQPDDFTQPQFGPLFQPVMQFP